MYHGLGRDESNCLWFAVARTGRAVGRCEREFKMGSGVAAEQDGTPDARQGVFGRWTEGVSPNVVISLVGSILAIRVGGSLGGILRMLDS